METIQLKTNIKCADCVAKVTPYLNEAIGAEKWKVDIANPLKILTVDEGDQERAIEALQKAGYKGEGM